MLPRGMCSRRSAGVRYRSRRRRRRRANESYRFPPRSPRRFRRHIETFRLAPDGRVFHTPGVNQHREAFALRTKVRCTNPSHWLGERSGSGITPPPASNSEGNGEGPACGCRRGRACTEHDAQGRNAYRAGTPRRSSVARTPPRTPRRPSTSGLCLPTLFAIASRQRRVLARCSQGAPYG